MNKIIKPIVASVLLAAPIIATAGNLNGSYVGASIGAISAEDAGYETGAGGAPDGYSSNNQFSGETYGVFGGHNWLFDNQLLLGVEVAAEKRSASQTSYFIFSGTPDTCCGYSTRLESAYTVKGKAGYTFNNQHSAVYVAAGLTSAKQTRAVYEYSTNSSQSESVSLKGKLIGIGLEHMISDSLSVTLDYSVTKYDESVMDANPLWANWEVQSNKESAFRFGLAYRF